MAATCVIAFLVGCWFPPLPGRTAIAWRRCFTATLALTEFLLSLLTDECLLYALTLFGYDCRKHLLSKAHAQFDTRVSRLFVLHLHIQQVSPPCVRCYLSPAAAELIQDCSTCVLLLCVPYELCDAECHLHRLLHQLHDDVFCLVPCLWRCSCQRSTVSAAATHSSWLWTRQSTKLARAGACLQSTLRLAYQ